jgi:hypothetical protein
MILQQGHETLAHHTGCANHTNSILFHQKDLLSLYNIAQKGKILPLQENSS